MVNVNHLPANTFCLYRGMLYRKWLFQLALSYDRPLNIKQYIIMLNYSVSQEFGKSIMVLCFCSVMSETSTGNLQRLGMTCWLEAWSLEGHLFTCQPEHLYSSCGCLGFLRARQLCSKNICPKRIRQKLYHLSLELHGFISSCITSYPIQGEGPHNSTSQ